MLSSFSEICRLCMKSESSLLPILQQPSELCDRIQTISPIVQVRIGDGLPQQICETCVQQVDQFWKFKLQCELSDATLRQHLKQQLDVTEVDVGTTVNGHCGLLGNKYTECINRTNEVEENKVKTEIDDTSRILEQHGADTLFSNNTLRWAEEHKQIIKSRTPNTDSVKCHRCKVCGKLVQRLKLHMMKHTGDRPYQCSQCGRRFTQLGSLKKHQTLHSDVSPHQCLICGKCFRCKSDLSLHSKLHTGKSYDCAHCGKRFVTQRAMDNHNRIHTGEKPFLCHLCGVGFNQEGNLSMHLKIHQGEKPFRCSVCGKEFTTRAHLSRHLSTHTGERPYSCAICGKCFRDRGTLMRHQTVHSGERSFCCSVCHKSFTQLISLKRHSRLHTGEKPFQCGQCDEAFVLKRDLKRHCEKLHLAHSAISTHC